MKKGAHYNIDGIFCQYTQSGTHRQIPWVGALRRAVSPPRTLPHPPAKPDQKPGRRRMRTWAVGEALIQSLCDRLFDGGLTGGIQRPAFRKSDDLSILRGNDRPRVIITIRRRPTNGLRTSHAATGYDHSTTKSFRASLRGILSPSICKSAEPTD